MFIARFGMLGRFFERTPTRLRRGKKHVKGQPGSVFFMQPSPSQMSQKELWGLAAST